MEKSFFTTRTAQSKLCYNHTVRMMDAAAYVLYISQNKNERKKDFERAPYKFVR